MLVPRRLGESIPIEKSPGSDHKDANVILYLDYVAVFSSNHVNVLSSLNIFSHTHNSPTYCYNLINSLSIFSHYSNKCSFYTHDLYQLKSSHLIQAIHSVILCFLIFHSYIIHLIDGICPFILTLYCNPILSIFS